MLLVAGAAAFFVVARRRDGPADDERPGRASRARRAPTPDVRVRPGNVVLLHSDERLTLELRELAERIAGPPDEALEAAGQAVLVQQRRT